LTDRLKESFEQLNGLADSLGCSQEAEGGTVCWKSFDDKLEAMFFVKPDPADLNAFIAIYQKIRETECPISFVFVESEKPGCYDIFRLSALSYLEHHNQAKL
jgi:hypothetical protein